MIVPEPTELPLESVTFSRTQQAIRCAGTVPFGGASGHERRMAQLGGKFLRRFGAASLALAAREPRGRIVAGLAKHADERAAGRRPDRAIDLVAIDHEHKARNRFDPKLRGQIALVVDIHGPHWITGGRELLDDRVHLPAGAAPIGAEIEHDGVARRRDRQKQCGQLCREHRPSLDRANRVERRFSVEAGGTGIRAGASGGLP